MKKIITCNLPLPIQRLYIKRLKHMVWRWEFENFCGHCPGNWRYGFQTGFTTKIERYGIEVCSFCRRNVGLLYGCPCNKLRPKTALKRAKDFIERFETGDGGEA